MITVDEALDLVVANAGRQELYPTVFDEAVGRVLAEDVVAHDDSPPFDKSMMDGFAVVSEDVNARRPLKVVGEIRAGSEKVFPIASGETVAIMTGARMPPGTDAVVVVERCKVSDGVMTTDIESVSPGANVLRRGMEYKNGQTVLKPGRPLMPAEVGVLASVGCFPDMYRRPRVAVIATGDELVRGKAPVAGSQIRDSNTPTLVSLLAANGCEVEDLGIGSDQHFDMESRIRKGLRYDVLILTGGVSMGTADLVPEVLAKFQVQKVFHKVALKPGMPVWFGKFDFTERIELPGDPKIKPMDFHLEGLVFGLPGNPVSVLACFELFVTTALRARQGWSDPLPRFFNARLESDFNYPTKRETYHPAKLVLTDDGPLVSPVPWFGSADVLGASRANALVVLPVGPGEHKTGDRLRVLPLSKPGWIWTCSGAGGAS